ncbi:MAG TPA: OsmC family protein [Edaphocola sp.]|nr:OsmC family protein [Edaphocola sp.]
MVKISVAYHKPSQAFVAKDEFGNSISFKVDRKMEANDPISEGSSTSPMTALLMAMGACSGIDIVLILEKQKQDFDSLTIEVEGARAKDLVPALWLNAHIKYLLTGNINLGKAQKAAQLSVDKYCSVAEILRRSGCEITYEVRLN